MQAFDLGINLSLLTDKVDAKHKQPNDLRILRHGFLLNKTSYGDLLSRTLEGI